MNRTLRYLPPSRPRPNGDAVVERLMRAAITADVILEPPPTDPRKSPPQPVTPLAPPASAPSKLPRSAPGDGLRLVPLDAFHWGGAAGGREPGRIAPRVRGDHIVIRVMRGTLGINLPRLKHPVAAGRIAFIPAGTAFSLHPPDGIDGYALLIPPQFTGGLPIAMPAAFRAGAPDIADQPLLDPTMRALGHGSPRSPVDAAATAMQLGILAVALSRLAQGAAEQDAIRQRVSQARPLTEQFLAMAGANLSRNLTISEIAKDLGCSLAHLDRACQQSRGMTALNLLYRLRMERAVLLLRDTATPVPRIAEELGYSGIGHFMRAFAASTGRTPDDFRQICRP